MSDKYFSSVKLLCSFDGLDGATAFTDESSAARTVTFVGNAQLDTDQKRFGSTSLRLDGSGDYVTVPDSADFTLGLSDFTVECWARFNALPSAQVSFIAHYNATGGQRGWSMGYDHTNTTLRFLHSTNGANTFFPAATWTPTTGVWYHVAVTRRSGVFRFFVDGRLIGENSAMTANSIFDSASPLQIGAMSLGAIPLNGWIDEARFTVGVARYTSDFVVQRGPFSRGKRLGVAGEGSQPIIIFG